MSHEQAGSISFFQRYLTVWVFLCMVASVLIGYTMPAVPAFLDTLQSWAFPFPLPS